MNCFVLSVEGLNHIDKGNWTTHVIVGVYETEQEALDAIQTRGFDEDDIVVLTNMATQTAKRIER